MSAVLYGAVIGTGHLPIFDGVGAPDVVHNGIPYRDDNSICVDDLGVINHYHQGLPFTAAGRLVVDLSDPVIDHYGGGMAPFTSANRLVFANSAVARVAGGIPFTASGALAYELISKIFTSDFTDDFT